MTKILKITVNTALSKIFMILFYYKNIERKVLCKMTNFLLYGRNDSDFVPADNEDLKRSIYAYYCQNGYPNDLQKSIDSATQLLESGDVTAESEINDLLMAVTGAADIWAFWMGFKACADIMTGSLFQRILISQDDEEDDE